jgi:signal transduction histidine kinase
VSFALSSAVAHDVKNRLVILGEELAKLAALKLPAEAQAHVANANQQAMMLTSKLVEWLTVQRASEGSGLRAVPHEEMPGLFLEDLHSQALPLAGSRLEVVKEEGDLPAFWFYDPQLVRLAIDSALHNALRYARNRITLGARMDGMSLCFYVRDDGPGTAGGVPGPTSTGLGLKLCREVAHAHKNRGVHGHCSLRDHPGGGALFELYLP